MASAKAEQKAASTGNNNQGAASEKDFDWSKYVADGYAVDELRIIGGLTPIYVPEEALSQGFPPVFGKMDRIEFLPTQRQGQKDEWTPRMIRVVALMPTKAMGGTGDDRHLVDIAVGDDVLIPVTGNLSNNKTLLIAAAHEDLVFVAGFRVKGQKEIGRPSEMWDWDVRLHPKTERRAGRFMLPQGEKVTRTELPATTASGTAYDPRTGEVKDQAPVARA